MTTIGSSRWPGVVLVVIAFAFILLAITNDVGGTPVGAEVSLVARTVAISQDPPSPTLPNPTKGPSIIPRPNSGRDPQFEGERGTASQYAVMGAVFGGIAVMLVLAIRESRRKRAV